MAKRNRRKENTKKRRKPTKPINSIDPSDSTNRYLDEYEQFWGWLKSKNSWLGSPGLKGIIAWYGMIVHRFCIVLFLARVFQEKYGFGIPNQAALNRLRQLGKLIEIGAGLGYWAWLLRLLGVDILAFDKINLPGQDGSWFPSSSKNWTEVLPGDTSVIKEHPDRVLLLCYPPHKNDMASQALAAYAGEIFAYVATSQSFAVGDKAFHRTLDRDWELIEAIPIPGWLDFAYFRRKEIRLPMRWRQVSQARLDIPLLYIPPVNYGNNLFIFKKKKAA